MVCLEPACLPPAVPTTLVSPLLDIAADPPISSAALAKKRKSKPLPKTPARLPKLGSRQAVSLANVSAKPTARGSKELPHQASVPGRERKFSAARMVLAKGKPVYANLFRRVQGQQRVGTVAVEITSSAVLKTSTRTIRELRRGILFLEPSLEECHDFYYVCSQVLSSLRIERRVIHPLIQLSVC